MKFCFGSLTIVTDKNDIDTNRRINKMTTNMTYLNDDDDDDDDDMDN